MTRCTGIKNSVCDPTPSPASSSVVQLDPNNASQRFMFVNLADGLWSHLPEETLLYESNPILYCPMGGSIIFHYLNYFHDVVAMADADHYETCNFTNSITVSTRIQNPEFDYATYYHPCGTVPGKVEYLSCSIGNHCQEGQKIMIQTSSTTHVQDDATGEWLIHVASLERVMRLLGRTVVNNEFLVFTRGYQTEALANQTLQWIWCGLDHCPSFLDTTGNNVTVEDCEGAIYTLMGYVSRKRPIPRYDESEHYYRLAIDGGGANECAARSYLTKMYLDKQDFDNATLSANELCQVCGKGEDNDLFGTSVRQTKAAFEEAGAVVSWPETGPCATVPTTAPSDVPSKIPSNAPSIIPSNIPSNAPSDVPSGLPLDVPSNAPSITGPQFCFSGSTQVRVRNPTNNSISNKFIRDVQIGDLIQSNQHDDRFSPVYSLGHYHHEMLVDYLQFQITTNNNNTTVALEMSPNHMLLALGGSMIPASHVRVGQFLSSSTMVQNITTVQRRGAYAPLTYDGTLWVQSQTVASCYPSLFHLDQYHPKNLHAWSHAALSWRRGYCRYLVDCRRIERYTNDGIATWAYSMMTMVHWWLRWEEELVMGLNICSLLLLAFVFLLRRRRFQGRRFVR
mmetsp:Transcript_5584/g.8577  ORF Transcript_5584/g.8577 Transcript_5584/m.8577 type:complete len:622 (-) Transcript_5584:314-2179(-)